MPSVTIPATRSGHSHTEPSQTFSLGAVDSARALVLCERRWLSPTPETFPMIWIALLVMLLVVTVASSVCAFVAYKKHKRYQLLAGTEITSIGSLCSGVAKTT